MHVYQEIIWALRRIARHPASVIGVVLTLTLGIAISVGMFSVLEGVVLRALPYRDADRVVHLYSQNLEQNVPRGALTAAEAAQVIGGVPGFDDTAIYSWGGLVLEGETRRPLTTLFVSADYFSVLGVQPELGRTFAADDFVQRRPVILLTHSAWMDVLGGDPEAIGRTLPFEDGELEVIGVLPDSLTYLAQARAYRPLPAATLSSSNSWYFSARYLYAIGRLRDGVSDALADQGLQARAAALALESGRPSQGWQLRHTGLLDDLVGSVRDILFGLFGLALLVLVIACATSACLVSIRLEQRQAELAMRRTLGATSRRIALDVAVELSLLVGLATVGGVVLARIVVGIARPLAAGILPRADGLAVDRATLAFAVAAALATILLAGLGPLLRAVRGRSLDGLRGGTGRQVQGGRRIALLPAAGVGLSAVALVMALALAVSLVRISQVDPGYRIENIAAFQVFHNAAAETSQFVARVLPELRAAPGVRDAVAVSATPAYVVGGVEAEIAVPGSDSVDAMSVRMLSASPHYHEFLGIPLVKGRDISDQDTRTAPAVVVINETLARRAFGGADPVGRELLITAIGERRSYRVVGVARDTRNAGLRAPSEPELVASVFQQPFQATTLLVDSAIVPPAMPTLEQAIERAHPLRPINRSFMLSDDVETQLRQPRFFAAATGWFAALALVLGAAGVNAVVGALQRRRTREIGLRLALGAAPRRAAALIVGTALRMIVVGVAIGALLGVPAFRWIGGELYGIDGGTYWVIFGGAGLVLIASGLVAAGWPAWRAARTAPMEVLRHE